MSHLLLSSMERKNKKVRDLPLSPCDFNLIHSLLIILKDYKSKNLLNLGSYVFSFSPKHHHLFFYHVAFLSRWISCLFVFAVCNKSRAGREGAMGALLPLIRWRHTSVPWPFISRSGCGSWANWTYLFAGLGHLVIQPAVFWSWRAIWRLNWDIFCYY